MTTALPIVLCTLLHVGAAGATEPAPAKASVAPVDRFATPALALDVIAASNAPAGNVAFGLTWDVGRYLSTSYAAGMAVDGRFLNRRWALATRGRLPVSPALAIDAGLSLSWADGYGEEEYGRDDQGAPWSFLRYWDKAYRLNPEVGFDYRPTSRFTLRAFAGIGFPLAPGECTYLTTSGQASGCDSPQIPAALPERHSRFPYVGVSLGLGFLRFAPAPSDWGGFAPAASPRWYGWQLMVADGATLVVVPLILLARSPGDSFAPAFVVWGGDVTAAFALHALHNHPAKAAGSIALRIGLVGVGWRLGAQGPESVWMGAGAAIGWLVSVLIDDLLLARD